MLTIRKYSAYGQHFSKNHGHRWQRIQIYRPCHNLRLPPSESHHHVQADSKYNKATNNSIQLLENLINAQRGIVKADLGGRSTFLLHANESDILKAVQVLKDVRDRKKLVEAIQILANKSSLELSEIIKAAFSSTSIKAKEQQLTELQKLIDTSGIGEVAIQKKLALMPWVFGPEYEALDVRTAGSSGIPDRRLRRVDGLSDILEIKLPSAELLRNDGTRHYIAPELAEALGQLMGYLEYYYSAYHTRHEDATGSEILQDTLGEYYKPKGILLIGRRRSSEKTKRTVDTQPKDLRRLLSYFHWIEVLTYDDLLERGTNLIKKLSM